MQQGLPLFKTLINVIRNREKISSFNLIFKSVFYRSILSTCPLWFFYVSVKCSINKLFTLLQIIHNVINDIMSQVRVSLCKDPTWLNVLSILVLNNEIMKKIIDGFLFVKFLTLYNIFRKIRNLNTSK